MALMPAALAVIVGVWWSQSSLIGPQPAVWCPTPLPLMLLYMFAAGSGLPPLVLPLAVAAAFWLWSSGYLNNVLVSRRRTAIVALVVAGGSTLDYASTFGAGRAEAEMFGFALLSLMCAAVIAALLFRARTAAFAASLAANFLLFAQTFTVALPITSVGFDL